MTHIIFHTVLDLRQQSHPFAAGPCRAQVLHERLGVISSIPRSLRIYHHTQFVSKGIDGAFAFCIIPNCAAVNSRILLIHQVLDEIADPVALVNVLR